MKTKQWKTLIADRPKLAYHIMQKYAFKNDTHEDGMLEDMFEDFFSIEKIESSIN